MESLGAQLLHPDLTAAEDHRRLLEAAPEFYGLVVFAGDPARVKAPAEFEAVLERSREVNLLGAVMLAHQAVQRMEPRGTPGAIVLLAPRQAVAWFPGSLAYGAPKAALVHSARVLDQRGPWPRQDPGQRRRPRCDHRGYG